MQEANQFPGFQWQSLRIDFGIVDELENSDVLFISTDVGGRPELLFQSKSINEEIFKLFNKIEIDTEEIENNGYIWRGGKPLPISDIALINIGIRNSNTKEILKNNLSKVITGNVNFIENKRVLIPLMGTGIGGMTFKESLDIIMDVLINLTIDYNYQKRPFFFQLVMPDIPIEYQNELKDQFEERIVFFEKNLKDENKIKPNQDKDIEIIKNKIIAAKDRNFWWIKVANSVEINLSGQEGYVLGSDCDYWYITHDDPDPKIFSQIEQGDLIIGFKQGEKRQVNVIIEAVSEKSGNKKIVIQFKLIYVFADQIDWEGLLHIQVLNSGDFLKGNGEILRKLTNDEFKEIINTTELAPIEEESKSKPKPKDEDIPAYTDNPELEDKLGRLPIAKSIAAVVNKIWKDARSDSKKYGRSFMVHVQGQWGSGKTTFLNLIEKELKKDNWVVINYNAWQHQHIDPPWWTLLQKVYKQARKQLIPPECLDLAISEFLRRLRTGSFLMNLLSFIIIILTIILPFFIIPNYMDAEESDLGNTSSIVSLVAGIIALYYTVRSSLKQSLAGSATSATAFAKLAKDPMIRINKHFSGLVKSIKRPVAIFIDDLDRCEPDFTVKLIEGIQTLFRETEVLYVVAADRNWIAKCFEIHYENFEDTVIQKGTRLGYLFTQKAFQLTVRMPKLSEDQVKEYWDYILRIKKPEEKEKQEKEIKAEFAGVVTETEVKQRTKEIIEKKIAPESMVRAAAIDKLNEGEFLEVAESKLRKYACYLDPNPRSIKRLANFYNVFDRTLFLEDRELETSVMVRWLLLSQRWPILADALEKAPYIIEALDNSKIKVDKKIMEILELQEVQEIIKGKNNDEKLTTKEIMNCIGWDNTEIDENE